MWEKQVVVTVMRGWSQRCSCKATKTYDIVLFSCLYYQNTREKEEKKENGESNEPFAWKKTTTKRKRGRWEWYLTEREAEASVGLYHWESSSGTANPLKLGGKSERETRFSIKPVRAREGCVKRWLNTKRWKNSRKIEKATEPDVPASISIDRFRRSDWSFPFHLRSRFSCFWEIFLGLFQSWNVKTKSQLNYAKIDDQTAHIFTV